MARKLLVPDCASIPDLPSSMEGLLAWAMVGDEPLSLLWICDGMGELEQRHRDMLAMAPDPSFVNHVLYFPERDLSPGEDGQSNDQGVGDQLYVLRHLREQMDVDEEDVQHPVIVLTCVQALMQRVLNPQSLDQRSLELSTDQNLDRDDAVTVLLEAGYHQVLEVEAYGQLCVKGGILDVWPLTSEWPIRIEFFGDEIASIRIFNPADQRSLERIESLRIPPMVGAPDGEQMGSLADYLSSNTVCVWSRPESIREHAEILSASFKGMLPESMMRFEDMDRHLSSVCDGTRVEIGTLETPDAVTGGEYFAFAVEPMPRVGALSGEFLHPDVMGRHRQELLQQHLDRAKQGWIVYLFMDTQGALEHYVRDLDAASGVNLLKTCVGALSGGFVVKGCRLAVLCEADLVGRPKRAGTRYRPIRRRQRVQQDAGERLGALSVLEPGDLVVHSDHGLGRFEGLSEIVFNGETQEVATIEYADEARLHVPASQVYLLSRYVGMSRRIPRLHKLGGRRWSREKSEAEDAVADLASSLLETQAHRDALKGCSFGPDKPWQHDFEAAFPFRETPDQETAVREVKGDLESERPMDRLICGDAGYGKTEVAMRAAFKVVMEGAQVAVLVPTTVLAQQHFETFQERMAVYPFRIEMLSRFCSQGRRAATLRGLKEGVVDIVIGTHALVQPTIGFKNLGLVIIDEEQRFGVKHKERLKQVRKLVDVLTLTATPIPRTLYMSMTGARDMSLIQTPPRERVAIETIVTRNSDEVIRRAIMRELNREGQVFFLYNRVMTIERTRERLERLVPEARMTVAHGQMRAGELSRIMHAFVSGEYDVLVCTTIIESGVDIPRANTILIDRADRFGIADLYQLRGRVGRSNHKAYAYLLLPPRGRVDADARERIGALRKHSSLSAGFQLALRDLEIRGAGNILGAQQSGYISAVGFGLYCQLLRRSIAGLRGEKTPRIVDTELHLDFIDLSPRGQAGHNAAGIPYDYIEEEGQRLDTYNRLARCADGEEVTGLRESLRDRYGPLPVSVDRMLRLAGLRIRAADQQMRSVRVREGKVMLLRHGDYIMRKRRHPRLESCGADACLSELEIMVETVDDWADRVA